VDEVTTEERIVREDLLHPDDRSSCPTAVDVRFTIVYDDIAATRAVQAGWGFACVAEVGSTRLLFDTGSDGSVLLGNLERLEIMPREIEMVVISHNRYSHIGGLEEFLKVNPNVTVCIPRSFPALLAGAIKKSGAELIRASSFAILRPHVFTLGEIAGVFREQAIAIRSSRGVVIITGCAHNKTIDIVQRAKDIFTEEPIHLVLGGFHLHGFGDSERSTIVNGFQELRVEKVAPSHCTEETAREMFGQAYGEDYIELGVGRVIEIPSEVRSAGGW
jgi:7,8-dihydropterin-6-yl-methyl-4-(beta-D-ribofuranosyl)aminobenzene 5'-phosphate synthase